MLRFENDDGRSLFCKSDLMVKWVHGQGKKGWYGDMLNAIQIIIIKIDDQKSISAKIVSN